MFNYYFCETEEQMVAFIAMVFLAFVFTLIEVQVFLTNGARSYLTNLWNAYELIFLLAVWSNLSNMKDYMALSNTMEKQISMDLFAPDYYGFFDLMSKHTQGNNTMHYLEATGVI